MSMLHLICIVGNPCSKHGIFLPIFAISIDSIYNFSLSYLFEKHSFTARIPMDNNQDYLVY